MFSELEFPDDLVARADAYARSYGIQSESSLVELILKLQPFIKAGYGFESAVWILDESNWNVEQAAKVLDIDVSTRQ